MFFNLWVSICGPCPLVTAERWTKLKSCTVCSVNVYNDFKTTMSDLFSMRLELYSLMIVLERDIYIIHLWSSLFFFLHWYKLKRHFGGKLTKGVDVSHRFATLLLHEIKWSVRSWNANLSFCTLLRTCMPYGFFSVFISNLRRVEIDTLLISSRNSEVLQLEYLDLFLWSWRGFTSHPRAFLVFKCIKCLLQKHFNTKFTQEI